MKEKEITRKKFENRMRRINGNGNGSLKEIKENQKEDENKKRPLSSATTFMFLRSLMSHQPLIYIQQTLDLVLEEPGGVAVFDFVLED